MSKILLIDGSNYLFRAFHGLPDLRTSQNEPTGAIKGFLGMLSKVLSLSKPDFAVIVFDAPGKNFRHDMYPDYKANRPPMPDDLRVQIEPLLEILRLTGWPLISVPGVEADDVLATLAERARAEGVKSIIATGDKDMAQLVDDDIVLLNTMNVKFYDREGIIEKYGVAPEHIIDYLALMGDKVDNVPGIDKCGPVTAAKWVNLYGGLEDIIARADEVGGKIGERLREGLPFLPKAKDLVTIKRDCDLPPDVPESVKALTFKGFDDAGVQAFCSRWEMNAMTARRAAPKTVALATPTKKEEPAQSSLFDEPSEIPQKDATLFEPAVLAMPADASSDDVVVESVARFVVSTPEDLEALAACLNEVNGARPVAVSVLWRGAARHAEIVALGFAPTAAQAFVISLDKRGGALSMQSVRETLGPWLEGTSSKVFDDAKAAAHVFASNGIRLGGTLHDTSLMSYVLEAHLAHDLKSLARRYLKHAVGALTDLLGKGAKAVDFSDIDAEMLNEHVAECAVSTRAISSVLLSQLETDPVLSSIYHDIECPLVGVLTRMESYGVALDAFALSQQSVELKQRIDALTQQAYQLAGKEFNLGSPKQLGEVLFGLLGLPVKKKTASGAPSTDEEVLNELALDYPLPKLILELRQLTKLKSTYTDKLPKMVDPTDGRVHTTFGQTTAVTGRLASSDPNLQNIPVRTAEGRRVREAFIADAGNVIISADYSQIELRIMAHLSDDAALIGAFARGEDIHRATAAEVFNVSLDQVTPDERRMAKVINFGLIYGMSAFGLAQNLGIERRMAQHYIDEYFARYPGVARYMAQMRTLAHEQGYVSTVFGRRLWLPDIASSRMPVRNAAERAAINAPMQGTAADLIKKAMIAVDRWLREEKLGSRLVLQVHDELILEVPDSEIELVKEMLPKLMADVATLHVPLIAEVGVADNWEAAH